MSRWIEHFNNHKFQKAWKGILEESDKIEVDNTIPTDVQELARLKKTIKYLDELLNACDPELIPSSTWDNYDFQSNESLAQIRHFNQNKNIGHLKNSNGSLDNLLTYLRPYIISPSSAAQAANKSFKSYSETITKEMNSFKKQVENNVTNIKNNFDNSEKTLSSINKINDKITEFDSNLFTDKENAISFKTKTENLLKETEVWHEKVKNYHNTLLINTEERKSLKDQVDVAIKIISDGHSSVTQTLKDIESDLADFREFYSDTFGSKNKDTGEYEGGLKKKLEDGFTKYNALLESIEKLLPGATSAGLASAYGALKDSFNKTIKYNTRIFYATLAVLIVTSLATITSEVGWFFIKFVDISDFQKLLPNFLYKLPLVVPVVWLAFFASRRRSEAQRLQQEYAHKEAITRSYQRARYPNFNTTPPFLN